MYSPNKVLNYLKVERGEGSGTEKGREGLADEKEADGIEEGVSTLSWWWLSTYMHMKGL